MLEPPPYSASKRQSIVSESPRDSRRLFGLSQATTSVF